MRRSSNGPQRAASSRVDAADSADRRARHQAAGLLGDTVARDYGRKLRLFNLFAEPELRHAAASIGLAPGMRALDVGCGCGQTLEYLAGEVGDSGLVVGIDLAAAHAAAAGAAAAANVNVLQADLLRPPFSAGSFDLIWAVNTINHLRSPLDGLQQLARLLRPNGRIVLGQSSLLPDMYLAWDYRLERLVDEAVRRCYRDRYGLEERDTTASRAIVGLLRNCRFREIKVRTIPIERIAPLREADEAYLMEVVFRGFWGERLKPYLPAEDFAQLREICNPEDDRFALKRPDFHFVQTLTLAIGAC